MNFNNCGIYFGYDNNVTPNTKILNSTNTIALV